jgi:hypothetical protein
LEEALFGRTVRRVLESRKPMPEMARIHEELQQHSHLTLQLVWEEYRQAQSDGYGYSRFCDLYQQWRRQPMLAVWAEMDVVLADEFRDGNVPAQMAPLTVAQAAFAAVPKTVTSYYYRGDSACHEKELLRWLLDEKREDGPTGFIGLAISARMSDALRAVILEVPEAEWKGLW